MGVVELTAQANPAYHCRITMADEGACDYVQYAQHEASRRYHMEHGVLCGWENVRYLNLTHCDCTAASNQANGCNREHCLRMALQGVVCGNCGNCDQNQARKQIFGIPHADPSSPYDGICALASTAESTEERHNATMGCSRGLFCRSGNMNGDACQFHCEHFPQDSICIEAQREKTNAQGRKLFGFVI